MARLTRNISLLFVATILIACGSNRAPSVEDKDGSSANEKSTVREDDCPAELPEEGAQCDRGTMCNYFVRGSHCMPGVSDYDIYDRCNCMGGRWRCRQDSESCYPEPDAGADPTCPVDSPEESSSCDVPYEGTICDYFIRGSYCMPGVPDYDIYNHCKCEDGTWSCNQDWEDCFPEPDAGTDS